MGRRRERWLAVITVVGSFALCLAAAEGVLRFLPVASGIPTMPVTAESPVYHFMPNRDFVFSRDWDMAMVNHGHTNNAGFVNDQDYRKDGETPLIAVIGDSYIEAAMVPFGETVHGRLAKALEGKFRVYSFAAAGTPLSQYLIWARHAVSEYGAQALVINVVGNDFDESLAAYNTRPGLWLYVPDANQVLRLRLFEYRPPARPRFLWSALMRYINFNLRLGLVWLELKPLLFGRLAMAEPRYAGNTAVDAGAARVKDSLAAIDAFFRDLPDLVGLPSDRIAFTLDGFRYPENAAGSAGTYFDLMRHAFQDKALALGYEVIDLDPPFFLRHGRTGERFEYPRDGHWNPAGHEVAFEAVMVSRLSRTLVR